MKFNFWPFNGTEELAPVLNMKQDGQKIEEIVVEYQFTVVTKDGGNVPLFNKKYTENSDGSFDYFRETPESFTRDVFSEGSLVIPKAGRTINSDNIKEITYKKI